MSREKLTRERGVIISCDVGPCRAQHICANIMIRVVRRDAQAHGWVGVKKPRMLGCDFCPAHAAAARITWAQFQKWDPATEPIPKPDERPKKPKKSTKLTAAELTAAAVPA